MKRNLIIIAIVGLAMVLATNALAQNTNQRNKKPGNIRPKPTVNDEGIYYIDSWNAKRKNKSTARTTNRKPIGRPNGICTGCCDPCYEDDVAKFKNQRRSRKPSAKHKIKKRKQ